MQVTCVRNVAAENHSNSGGNRGIGYWLIRRRLFRIWSHKSVFFRGRLFFDLSNCLTYVSWENIDNLLSKSASSRANSTNSTSNSCSVASAESTRPQVITVTSTLVLDFELQLDARVAIDNALDLIETEVSCIACEYCFPLKCFLHHSIQASMVDWL